MISAGKTYPFCYAHCRLGIETGVWARETRGTHDDAGRLLTLLLAYAQLFVYLGLGKKCAAVDARLKLVFLPYGPPPA